jgi:hypothetical protein
MQRDLRETHCNLYLVTLLLFYTYKIEEIGKRCALELECALWIVGYWSLELFVACAAREL